MTDTTVVLDDDEFDLDAAAAESAKAPLRFRWKGESWSMKHMSSVDWRIIEAANSGEFTLIRKAFSAAMGKEQFERWEEVDQDLDAVTMLFTRWREHAGVTEGESPASADSSASSEKPSRPASQRTTRASGSRTSGKARSAPAS
jgi:hypothetical protein